MNNAFFLSLFTQTSHLSTNFPYVYMHTHTYSLSERGKNGIVTSQCVQISITFKFFVNHIEKKITTTTTIIENTLRLKIYIKKMHSTKAKFMCACVYVHSARKTKQTAWERATYTENNMDAKREANISILFSSAWNILQQ